MKSQLWSKSKLVSLIVSFFFMVGVLTTATGAGSSKMLIEPAKTTNKSVDEFSVDRYIVLLKTPSLAMHDNLSLNMKTPAGRLDVRSAAAVSYVQSLVEEQDQFLSAVSSELGRAIAPIDPAFRFYHAVNGMVVDLTEAEAYVLQQRSDVMLVEREKLYFLDTDNGPPLIGAPTIWNGSNVPGGVGTLGEGVVIGIIDSGANIGSPSFADIGGDGFDHANPLGAGIYLGWCNPAHPSHDPVRDICNDKVIGGWDFTDATAPANSIEARGFEDSNGHGSHVASTAAGNVRTATFNGIVRNVSGVAPHANLVIYDACYTAASGTGTCAGSATVGSINQAVADGIIDVINYSISGGTQPWSEAQSLAFLAAHNAGIAVAASAGNSGPGAATLGHVEPWVISSAASTHDRVFGFSFSLTDPAGAPVNTQNITTRPGAAPIAAATLSGPLIVSPNFANGATDGCTAFPANFFRRPADPAGEQGIAVLQLNGTTSQCGSVTRRAAALAAGAAGVLFVDVTPLGLGASGTSYSMLLGDWNNVAAHVATDPASARATIVAPIALLSGQADVVASFSSRGPNEFSLLKPDVAAPGFEILAAGHRWAPAAPAPFGGVVNPALNDTVFLSNGTSMASPHSAGSIALLRALNRSWTPTQIKSALVTTANTNMVKQDSVTPSDPFDRGGGRVDLTQAARVGLLFDETGANFLAANPATGGVPENLNLPSIAANSCVGVCVFPRTVRSAASGPVTWTLSFSGALAGAASVNPTSFLIGASASRSLTISVDSTLLATGVHTFGELVMTPSDGSIPVARVPMAVRPGVTDIAITPSTLSATVTEGATTTRGLVISNAGNPTLDWSLANGTQPVTLFSQLPGAGSGFISARFAASAPTANRGAYVAEDFDLLAPGGLTTIRADGFVLPGGSTLSTLNAPQLNIDVYADAGGVPAGAPDGVGALPLWTFTLANTTPTPAGVSVAGNNIQIDLAAAGAPPMNLPAGKYWYIVYPNMRGAGSGANATNPLWAWRYVGTGTPLNGLGPRVITTSGAAPSLLWGIPTASGVPLNGFASVLGASVECGVSWASADINSASLGLAGASNLTVTFDSAGLAPGTYTGYLCVSTNGTDPDESVVQVPLTFIVNTAATTAPSGIGSATPGVVPVTTTSLLTVVTTPGLNPDSTGLAVTANLNSIGGLAAQPFFDNGSNGDVTAGDGIFSFEATIGISTAPGLRSLSFTVSDAELRSSPGTIELTVPAPAAITGSGVATPANVLPNGLTTLTFTVVPGANPNSTGIAVTADLSSIGGAADQQLFDDGNNGDVTGGDNTYSFAATVDIATSAGVKNIPVTVSDAQGRTTLGAIALNVPTPGVLSAGGLATPSQIQAGGDVVITVFVSPGTDPESTGLTAVIDLSGIGGSTTQALSDDGTNGDQIAGDNVFTYATSAPSTAGSAVWDFPVTITDEQGRTLMSNVTLEVIGSELLFQNGFEGDNPFSPPPP